MLKNPISSGCVTRLAICIFIYNLWAMISPPETKFRTWEDRWLFKHKRWVALPSIQWKGFWSVWKVRDMVIPAQFHMYIFHSRIVHYNTIRHPWHLLLQSMHFVKSIPVWESLCNSRCLWWNWRWYTLIIVVP
jgi:hypothetical protein